jgi:hypothetical protein
VSQRSGAQRSIAQHSAAHPTVLSLCPCVSSFPFLPRTSIRGSLRKRARKRPYSASLRPPPPQGPAPPTGKAPPPPPPHTHPVRRRVAFSLSSPLRPSVRPLLAAALAAPAVRCSAVPSGPLVSPWESDRRTGRLKHGARHTGEGTREHSRAMTGGTEGRGGEGRRGEMPPVASLAVSRRRRSLRLLSVLVNLVPSPSAL